MVEVVMVVIVEARVAAVVTVAVVDTTRIEQLLLVHRCSRVQQC